MSQEPVGGDSSPITASSGSSSPSLVASFFRRFTERRALDTVSTVAILIATAVLIAANWHKIFPPPRHPLPATPLSLDGATLKGSGTAPIVLIEFSDYQCPYCAAAEKEPLAAIKTEYIDTNRVQLAFRHNPLTAKHPQAMTAAEAALCAGQQGKFWEIHAALFRNPMNLTHADLVERAADAGLDLARFSACLASGQTAKQVEDDMAIARAIGLSGTPAFLIGRRQVDGRVKVTGVLVGAMPVEAFAEEIERAGTGESGRWMYASLAVAAVVIGVGVGISVRRTRAIRRP